MSDSGRVRFISLVLAFVTLLLYLPVWHYGFVLYDDPEYVTGNPIVQAGWTWAGVKWAFTTWHVSNWHPVTWLSLMLDDELFGLNPGAFHLVNVGLHIANTLLLFRLCFRMTRRLWPAAFAAALFAWHPLHVESVAWVAERKDVLSTFFGLLTLQFYVRYSQSISQAGLRWARPDAHRVSLPDAPQNVPTALSNPVLDPRSWTLDFSLALLCFVLGLMSKPMLVTLPLVLLLLDYWPLQRRSRVEPSSLRFDAPSGRAVSWRRLVLEKWPFFLLMAGSCVVTFLAQSTRAVATLDEYPSGLRIGNALISCVRYLSKTIWPTGLAVLHPAPAALSWWQVAGAVVVLVVISVSVWRVRRQSPCWLAGWLWFLGTLVPVMGVVQVGSQAMADRYTYLPLAGVFMAVAYGAGELAARFRFGTGALSAAAGLLLTGCVVVTEQQLRCWADSVALFTRAIAASEDNALAHYDLGTAFDQQGRPEEALAEYREALRIGERHPRMADTLVTPAEKATAHLNLGGRFEHYGHPGQALSEYGEAVQLDPGRADAHIRIGALLVKLDRFDEAMREYAEAARLEPNDPQPHYLMGKACLDHGQVAEAIARFRDALRRNRDEVQTLMCLACVLACDENPQVRNGAEAVALAERANRLTGDGQPPVLDLLAAAYAETGRFEEARRIEQRAIDLATAAGAGGMIRALRKHLELYQSGSPCREAFGGARSGR